MPVAHYSKKNAVSLYEQLQSPPIGLQKIFIDYFFFQADQWDCTKSSSIFNRFASSEQPERAKFVASQFPTRSLGWLVNYGRPFVSKLGHDMRVVFSHVYLQSFLLHHIHVFFLPHILAFFPALWGFYSQVCDHFLTNVHIYAHKKAHIYAFQTSMCLWGHRKSSYKRHRIILFSKKLLHV